MQELLNQLLAQSSQTQEIVSGMQGQFQQLGSRLTDLEQKHSGAQAATAPGWRTAPQLFNAAAPGLSEDKKETLKLLAARGPGKLGDLGANSRAAPNVLDPFGGTIAEAEEEDIDGEPLTMDPAASTLEKLLVAALPVSQAGPVQGQPERPVGFAELTLSGRSRPTSQRWGEGNCSSANAGRVTDQGEIGSCQEEVIQPRAGTKRHAVSLPRKLPLGSHKTLTHVSFISASMFQAIERGQPDRLHMLCLLLSVFWGRRLSVDGGSLRLAHLLTGLEDPPFAQTELHKAARSDLAHGALSDPRWVTTQLQ